MGKSLDGCRRENDCLGKKRREKDEERVRRKDAENSTKCLPRSRGNKVFSLRLT